MLSEIPPHEKVRFRRGEIASLDDLPSAVAPMRAPVWRSAPRGLLKAGAGVALALAVLAGVVAGAVVGGYGDETLRVEAEKLLSTLAGDGVETRIGSAGMGFDGLSGLAIEIEETSLAAPGSEAGFVRIGSARFSPRFAPLLRGAVEIGGVRLEDVGIDLAAMPSAGGAFAASLLDERGVVDADAVIAAVLAGVDRFAATFDAGGVDRVELRDVEILPPGGGAPLRITGTVVKRDPVGDLSLSATLETAGRMATLEGSAADGAFTLRLDAPPPQGGAVGDSLFGALELALHGARAGAGDRLTLSARAAEARLPLGREGLRSAVRLDLTAQQGADKVEIDRLEFVNGRSRWAFNGAVGPMPEPSGDEMGPAYRFELVSDGSASAPADSPEPALAFVARVAGHFDRRGRQIGIEEIGLRSGAGELSGNAALRLEPGKSPGVAFRLDVEDMPVAHAKQLWPVFAAPPARGWVLANVFGGEVAQGRIEMDVPPGRLGNGVPLGPDEVWGSFAVDRTRFDVAGRIPPVRDAFGRVDFRGTNVDIALDSGTAWSASGRTVDGTGGRLEIRDAHVRPVIGKLEIGVRGDADAILELARYEPIAVGRFIDIAPDELSGTVSGTVSADIPLQRGIPLESLGWRVALDYDNLALARPIEGQRVSQAKGSIVVDPANAVIDAHARLNDAPATLHLVEPLGADKSGRERRVAMQMDDGARRALAPGLDTLLSGPAQVELADGKGGARKVTVGLDRATLSIPWVGWSKGSGVPATAAFMMEKDGNRMALSDFRLDGDTFGATGALSLVDGALQRARFPAARLNRGDDFSVDVQAKGRGYAVTIRGDSLDVRSALKLHMKESGGSGGGGAGTPVTLDLQVASMTGFHGEKLRDVKLSFTGSGARTERLELSAVTAGGNPVSFSDIRDGEARTISMRSTDAGAVLRFLDIYKHMEGGSIQLSLSGRGDGPLSGHVDARDFWVVDEPRLSSIVSTTPQGDSRSLNQAVRGEIDTGRVFFDRGYSAILMSSGSLVLDKGVLRGPLIGMSFRGTLHDRDGNMALTGTFMPAYGLNRIFGEIPLIGQILGNGRDRGLIGITFRLAGKADQPQLQVNPLSVIAPGIFRSVFEFR